MHDTASKALESFSWISGGPGGGSNRPQQPQQFNENRQAGEQQQQFQQHNNRQQFQQHQLPPPRPLGGGPAGGEAGSGRGGGNAFFSFLEPLPPPRPAPVWGTSHSYYRSEATRVPFDRGELEYLQALFVKNPHFATSGRIAAMTLAHIRGDSAARAIFHERHVLNTMRLKAGFAALERAKAAARAGDPWGNDDDVDDGDGDDDGGDAYASPSPALGVAPSRSSSSSSFSSSSRPLRFFND
jgi:hypothetical protein